MDSASLLAGFVLGVGAASLAGWLVVRRRLGSVREAERRARASERMAEIGAMTGGLAHEIKNPLSSIGLNAQLLAEGLDELQIDADDRGRLGRRIGALRREVDRLRDILTDFLRFAGGVRIETGRVDLNAVVEEMSDFFTPQAEAAGIRLRCDLARGPLEVDLDASHFKQALLNLLLNALQAMTSGGGPEEQARAPADREIILRTERRKGPTGPSVAVHVIDTGPGIPADRIGQIFTPYFTTKVSGSGLGLPTTRRLVEEHGGRIEVHSEPGRGSDFVVSLPAPR